MKMRKPERRIYQHVLRELNVRASEAIFLDDIGQNLKPAKELGIRTIKVILGHEFCMVSAHKG